MTQNDILASADSRVIFQRGKKLFYAGGFCCLESDPEAGRFVYEVEGNYGDYRTEVSWGETLFASCSCPYPGTGCKHAVAVLLDLFDRGERSRIECGTGDHMQENDRRYLSPEEIRHQALEDRRKRAMKETFVVVPGDMIKGDHLVKTPKGREYQVTLHDPLTAAGHCSCPDYQGNLLGTCKHLMHLADWFHKKKDVKKSAARE